MTAPAPSPPGTIERVEGLDVIRVRVADLHVWAPPSRNARGSEPTTVGLARERLRAAGVAVYALIDGPMYGLCGGGGSYATATCNRVGYLVRDRARGVEYASTHPERGFTLARIGSGATARAAPYRADDAPDAADWAVQGYPPLVRDGAVVPGINGGGNAETNWRAGIGLLADQATAVFAVARASMDDFAHRLLRLGCPWAIYTDGGGSTRLMDGRGTWRGSSENRRVATVIFAAAPAGSGAIGVRDAAGNAVGAAAGAAGDGARVVGLSDPAKAVVAAGLGYGLGKLFGVW